MDLSGEYRIPATREAVFKALNDPEILKQCIPGCESLEKLSDTEMTARVALKIGPMTAKFTGKVNLTDLDPPNGYKISGEGQGGVAGFGKGSATVSLTADGGDTVLRYTADTQVGGKMAQLGARLIGATAKKLADDFFGKFAGLVQPTAAASSVGAAAAAPAPTASGGTRVSPMVWIPALIVVVALLLWWFGRS
jgi:carbon monoxide dehydrogenase subunit G